MKRFGTTLGIWLLLGGIVQGGDWSIYWELMPTSVLNSPDLKGVKFVRADGPVERSDAALLSPHMGCGMAWDSGNLRVVGTLGNGVMLGNTVNINGAYVRIGAYAINQARSIAFGPDVTGMTLGAEYHGNYYVDLDNSYGVMPALSLMLGDKRAMFKLSAGYLKGTKIDVTPRRGTIVYRDDPAQPIESFSVDGPMISLGMVIRFYYE